MKEGITVLSLFDGMSCGQIALERAGIKVKKYFAAEVDKYAVKVAQQNYPNTIQIGDVTKVSYRDGVLSTANGNFEVGEIDLVMGGSPCQSFSNLGDGSGFDGKSGLFFHWLRIKKEVNPKWFLLENVEMKKKQWEDMITNAVGVEPVNIDSSFFSAQSRKRLYWTNIEIREIKSYSSTLLRDVLEVGVSNSYYYDCGFTELGMDKIVCAKLNIKGHDFIKRVNNPHFKCQTLTAVCGGNQQKKVLVNGKVRKLTPLEYERLQTVPEGYTSTVSDSQRYKMLGNGWTVDVVAHIFDALNN